MKRLRIGIFGCGRGADLAPNFMMQNCDIVAICDNRKDRLLRGQELVGKDVAAYSSFDEFIEHDMDAVILANFFHEHTPYAIKCFERGIHVFSECISNGTMAEGVALVRAFEKTEGVVYMLAENYPQMIFNREIKRVCDTGTLGKIMYAEGEYNHPGPWDPEFAKRFNYFAGHWRNYLPRTYYITHSLGPVMYATGASPRRVTAFAIYNPTAKLIPSARRNGDNTAVIMMHNDDGSIYRVTGSAAFGGHHNAYRVAGNKGQIENIRGTDAKVMLRYNGWTKPEGAEEINYYDAQWNDKDEEMIGLSGHGGSDYLTARMFIECIREKKQPPHPFDVYGATLMSSVGILAHRSVLDGGKPYDVPDFRNEKDRMLYENDYLSPFPGEDGKAPTLPCCSHPEHTPPEENLRLFEEWLDDSDVYKTWKEEREKQ